MVTLGIALPVSAKYNAVLNTSNLVTLLMHTLVPEKMNRRPAQPAVASTNLAAVQREHGAMEPVHVLLLTEILALRIA